LSEIIACCSNSQTTNKKPLNPRSLEPLSSEPRVTNLKPCLKNLILLAIFILTSCATVRQHDSVQEKPAIAETIQDIRPVWQSFSPEAKETIVYFYGKTIQPRLEYHALRIDLLAPQLRIVAAAGKHGDKPGTSVLSTKVTSFVLDNNLIAGINALPFDPVSDKEGEYRSNSGIVISDGYVLSGPHPSFDALVFYNNGTAAIIPQSKIISAVNIDHAVGGFYQILISGEASARSIENNSRHPRSAAGISGSGQYLYLLVIDGRRPGSAGSTEAETAMILKQLGAYNGINFDGGGSSCLALRFADGKVKAVNIPVHNNIHGNERAVAGCIGVKIMTNVE